NVDYSGSTLGQSAAIVGNTITGHPYGGTRVDNRIGSAGTIGQALLIADNTIAQASRAGIVLYSAVSGTGTALSQSVNIESNSIASIGTEFSSYLVGRAVALFVGTKP